MVVVENGWKLSPSDATPNVGRKIKSASKYFYNALLHLFAHFPLASGPTLSSLRTEVTSRSFSFLLSPLLPHSIFPFPISFSSRADFPPFFFSFASPLFFHYPFLSPLSPYPPLPFSFLSPYRPYSFLSYLSSPLTPYSFLFLLSPYRPYSFISYLSSPLTPYSFLSFLSLPPSSLYFLSLLSP